MDWTKLKKEIKEKLGITYLLPHQELVVTHIAANEENNKEMVHNKTTSLLSQS